MSSVHGYNGEQDNLGRSAAETAVKPVLVSPTERSEPDELGYATVGRKVAGSSHESFKMGIDASEGWERRRRRFAPPGRAPSCPEVDTARCARRFVRFHEFP